MLRSKLVWRAEMCRCGSDFRRRLGRCTGWRRWRRSFFVLFRWNRRTVVVALLVVKDILWRSVFPGNGRLKTNQGSTLFGDVVLDELSILGNHVLRDTCGGQFRVQQTPLWRRLVVVVEHASGSSHSLVGLDIDVLTSRSDLGGLRSQLALQCNGVLVFQGVLRRILLSVGHTLEEMGGIAGVLK